LKPGQVGAKVGERKSLGRIAEKQQDLSRRGKIFPEKFFVFPAFM